MIPTSTTLSLTAPQLTVWLVGVSFVLFQFFLQLSSGVIINTIMQEMQLSALTAGILGSMFYYVYTAFQIPVGILFDLKNTRFLMTLGVLVCSLACVLFAHSYSLSSLMISRLFIGGGAAFAFIGLSHLLRVHFPLKQFAFMIGLSETLGFMVTVIGIIGLGLLVNHWGWRAFINGAAIVGFIIAYFSWRCIPDTPVGQRVSNVNLKQLFDILKSGKLWINGFFVGLSFTVITVFGAMWAVPFIQVKLACSIKEASLIDAMVFCGAALSCPLFGYLANRFNRRLLMVISCLSTALLITVLLFLPILSAVWVSVLMFFIGLCCGAYMLSYSIANELAPPRTLSTCTGFTNTLAMLSAPLMQPLVGYILDRVAETGQPYRLHAYQIALSIIPLGLIIASGLVFFLPKKSND